MYFLLQQQTDFKTLPVEPEGLFLNLTDRKVNTGLYDYSFFNHFWRFKGIDIGCYSVDKISNFTQTHSSKFIPEYVTNKLKSELDGTKIYYDKFNRRFYKYNSILNNGISALNQIEKFDVQKITDVIKLPVKFKYNDNKTYRFTHPSQVIKKYNWKDVVMTIDIKSQDFSVIHNMFNYDFTEDPYTDISKYIQESREDIKFIIPMLLYGASRDNIIADMYKKGISKKVYEKIIEIPIIKEVFYHRNQIDELKTMYSYYLERPIETEINKNFPRYVQTSSSDTLYILLSKLFEENLSKYLFYLKHDELYFYSNNFDQYQLIIDFFINNLTEFYVNHKKIKFHYMVKFQKDNEILTQFSI